LPAIVTHSFFADEVFDRMEESSLKQGISTRRSLFRLGAQGPDLFFYYKAAPWSRYDGIEKLGNLMHDQKIGSFYSESLTYLGNLTSGEGYFDVAAYIAGYLCHYALDRTAHPFIHYTSGIDIEHSRISWKYHIYHRVLESAIDYLSLEKKDLDPGRFKSYELIKIDIHDIEPVLRYYEYIIPRVYGMPIDRKQSGELVTGIYKVLRRLYDPAGIKYYLYRLLELFMGRPGGITSSMIPRKLDQNIDYLNLKHKPWSHPCYKERVSKESFWEIYERALIEAVKFMHLVSSCIGTGRMPGGLGSLIGDISYSSGIKCGSPDRLKYFDSIFEAEGNH